MIKYQVRNLITGTPEEFIKLSDAQDKLEANRAEYLQQESNRFHSVKVIAVEGGERWVDINFDADEETGNYQVFNHLTGQYDAFTTLTEVRADIDSKKQEFVISVGLDTVNEVDVTPQ